MEEYQESPLIDSSAEAEPEKRESGSQKNFVAWIIIGGALLLGCVFGAIMLLRGIDGFGSRVEVSEAEEPKPREKKDSVTVPTDEVVVDDAVHYLGDERNGYVKVIGGEWKKLDREWSKGVQYYAGLYVLLISTLESETGSVKDYAQSLYDIAVPTFNVENVELEKTTFGDYEDAYKFVMKDERTSSWNVEWIFRAEDDKIHYILIQGTDLDDEKFKIPETFILKLPEEE